MIVSQVGTFSPARPNRSYHPIARHKHKGQDHQRGSRSRRPATDRWPSALGGRGGRRSRHVLITRKSALGTGPVSASYLADYLGRHQRGISLEHIRRDRILAEALAAGADPLHLALVFNIDHTNAMAYANAARNLLTGPAGQALSPHRPA